MKKFFVLLFFINFFIFHSKSFAQLPPIKTTAQTIVGNPASGGVGASGVTIKCTSGQYLTELRNKLKIYVENASPYEQQMMCKSFAMAAKSANYYKLITTGASKLVIKMHQGGSGCWGYTDSASQISTGNCSGIPYKNFAHWIIHESGHAIGARFPYLKSAFPLSALKTRDSSCYDSLGFMESYPLSGSCSYGKNITARSESFAESLSYFTTWMYQYGAWECARPFSNFKTQCSNTYAWEKANIYKGYEYF